MPHGSTVSWHPSFNLIAYTLFSYKPHARFMLVKFAVFFIDSHFSNIFVLFFWGEYNTRCVLVERITIVEVNSQIFLPPPSSCLLLFFVCRLICALDYFGKVKFPYLLYMPLENENGVQEMPIVHIDFVAYTQTFHTWNSLSEISKHMHIHSRDCK